MLLSIVWGLFFLLVTPSYAWEYQLDQSSLEKPSLTELYEISSHFRDHGFFSLSDTSLSKIGFLFDNAYLGIGLKKNLVIKAGLVVPENLIGLPLYDSKLNVHIIHFKQYEVSYMVMGMNFAEDEFKQVVSPWIKKKVSLIDFVIPNVYAESCELPGYESDLKKTSQALSGEAILKKIGECGIQSLKGVGDQVSNTVDFFKKLVSNPKELWKETAESFNELENFVLNIDSELKTIFTNLGTMSLSDQLDIACHLSGHVFAMVAQSFIAGPQALARSLPLVVNKMKKLSEEIATASLLKKKGFKLPENKKLINEVTRCD